MTQIRRGGKEIFLNPGELWFGSGTVRLHTLLGSCVSVTLWHPGRRLGGMCHFLLPDGGRGRISEPSGKYADQAFELFDAEMRRADTRPREYQAKIFGGGNMFPQAGLSSQGDVGKRNVDMARRLLAQRSVDVAVEHVGGAGHRKLIFDVWSGEAWLNFQDIKFSADGG